MLKLSQCDYISQLILTAEAQSVFVKMCYICIILSVMDFSEFKAFKFHGGLEENTITS